MRGTENGCAMHVQHQGNEWIVPVCCLSNYLHSTWCVGSHLQLATYAWYVVRYVCSSCHCEPKCTMYN